MAPSATFFMLKLKRWVDDPDLDFIVWDYMSDGTPIVHIRDNAKFSKLYGKDKPAWMRVFNQYEFFNHHKGDSRSERFERTRLSHPHFVPDLDEGLANVYRKRRHPGPGVAKGRGSRDDSVMRLEQMLNEDDDFIPPPPPKYKLPPGYGVYSASSHVKGFIPAVEPAPSKKAKKAGGGASIKFDIPLLGGGTWERPVEVEDLIPSGSEQRRRDDEYMEYLSKEIFTPSFCLAEKKVSAEATV
jgi:hypothetical protein